MASHLRAPPKTMEGAFIISSHIHTFFVEFTKVGILCNQLSLPSLCRPQSSSSSKCAAEIVTGILGIWQRTG